MTSALRRREAQAAEKRRQAELLAQERLPQRVLRVATTSIVGVTVLVFLAIVAMLLLFQPSMVRHATTSRYERECISWSRVLLLAAAGAAATAIGGYGLAMADITQARETAIARATGATGAARMPGKGKAA